MKVSYKTVIIGFGKHASIEIPETILAQLGANRRAPLKVTVNEYTYQSTATGVKGKCMVVFPLKDRQAAGAQAGDAVTVTLELDGGYRHVEVPSELLLALTDNGLAEVFHKLTYSKRKEFARQVKEAKAADTRSRRISKIILDLKA